jgi:hypothetical protein
MNHLLTPPAERDLPHAAADRIRTRLLARTNQRPAPSPRRRLVATAAAAAVIAAGVTGVSLARHHAAAQTVIAMGPAELTANQDDAIDRCLTWAGQHPDMPFAIAESDLAVAATLGHLNLVLFYNSAGRFSCEFDGGVLRTAGGDLWHQLNWLPGTFDILSTEYTPPESGGPRTPTTGAVVAGRVSARVRRLVLQWGGHTVEARIDNGAYGLVTAPDADVTSDAQLVSYDASGQVIGRHSIFPDGVTGAQKCYTDPKGAIVYGTKGPDCQPADPWSLQR